MTSANWMRRTEAMRAILLIFEYRDAKDTVNNFLQCNRGKTSAAYYRKL